jgi:hypothetical protein
MNPKFWPPKHTLEPWSIDRVELAGTDDTGIAITANDEPVAVLCENHGTHLKHFDRAEANAWLIAAAPMMYRHIAGRAALGDLHAETFLENIMRPPLRRPVSAQDARADGWRN